MEIYNRDKFIEMLTTTRLPVPDNTVVIEVGFKVPSRFMKLLLRKRKRLTRSERRYRRRNDPRWFKCNAFKRQEFYNQKLEDIIVR